MTKTTTMPVTTRDAISLHFHHHRHHYRKQRNSPTVPPPPFSHLISVTVLEGYRPEEAPSHPVYDHVFTHSCTPWMVQ